MVFLCQYSWSIVSVIFNCLNTNLSLILTWFELQTLRLAWNFHLLKTSLQLLTALLIPLMFRAVTLYTLMTTAIARKVWFFCSRDCKHLFKNPSCWIVKLLNSEFWLWILLAQGQDRCHVILFWWITVFVCLWTQNLAFLPTGLWSQEWFVGLNSSTVQSADGH